MRVPVSWLREFVDVPGTPEDIAATLSLRGFAVESIESMGADVTAGSAAKASSDGAETTDTVIDFEVTANRPDCMSIVGLAREIATAYGLEMRLPVGGADTTDLVALEPAETADLSVIIESADLCPRYVGAVADVTVGPSPEWMRARLSAAGVRPISSIVDVTNYVMLELGQPMHAFDLATLTGAQIRVRNARPGEQLRTIDGERRTLTPDMLVIADAERACAVAGVMGGADSEVTSATSTIVLESAYFNPLSVRRTSKALGLKTEASMRFERGGDPGLPAAAMARACVLLQVLSTGSPRGTVVDRYPGRMEPTVMRLRRARIAGLLGTVIPDADIRRILEGLGFSLAPSAGLAPDSGWDVTVPTRRVDVRREVDLIEEVARHYTFDRLPVTFPAVTAAPAQMDPRITRARALRSALTAAGFSEAVTFGFTGEATAAPFAAEGDLVPIANPLSENFAVLRPSALPGLIDAVAHNRRREQRDVRLFEVGARFSRAMGERKSVACAWTGAAEMEHWSQPARDVDFFDIKGVAQRIGEVMRLEVQTAPCRETWLVPGRTAAVIAGGTRIGVVGQLAPAIAERHGVPGGDAVYVADIDLDEAERLAPQAEPQVEPLPRHPSVTRDVAILVDDTLPAADVRSTIQRAAPDTLVNVREFDRYQGKGVPEGKVSLALRLTFRSPNRTLTDSEVQRAMDGVVAALQSTHGAVQR